MFSSSLVALFAASAAVVSAQTTHQIVVGGTAGTTYTPNNITAAVGDVINFEFQSINHTVTQSAFAAPCALLQNATTQQTGFDSGFVPVSSNASAFPVWSLKVTATTPIWFYCRQTGHCQNGMVGAINAPTTGTNTFEAFQALAKSGGNASSTSSGTTTSGSTASTNGSTSAGSTDTPSSASSLSITRGAAALAAVAAGVLLL